MSLIYCEPGAFELLFLMKKVCVFSMRMKSIYKKQCHLVQAMSTKIAGNLGMLPVMLLASMSRIGVEYSLGKLIVCY